MMHTLVLKMKIKAVISFINFILLKVLTNTLVMEIVNVRLEVQHFIQLIPGYQLFMEVEKLYALIILNL